MHTSDFWNDVGLVFLLNNQGIHTIAPSDCLVALTESLQKYSENWHRIRHCSTGLHLSSTMYIGIPCCSQFWYGTVLAMHMLRVCDRQKHSYTVPYIRFRKKTCCNCCKLQFYSEIVKFCHAYVMVLHNCLRSIEERTAFCDVKFCHFIQEYVVPCTEVYSALLRLASISTEYMDNVWIKSMKNKCTQCIWKFFCACNSSSINYLLSVLPCISA